jgi:aspartokinase-like uncharacterized kinase
MRSAESEARVVVKVGGSLYDLHNLGSRLRRWLAELNTRSVLLVPGGGALVDAVRAWDAAQGLGEGPAHWLALRALTVAAHFLKGMLPGAVVVNHPDHWLHETLAVLDAYAFTVADDGRAGALPQSWRVTSDSLAGRAAHVANARRLVLLKSVTIPEDVDWSEAGRRGWVDACFAEAVSDELEVSAVNFRDLQGGPT